MTADRTFVPDFCQPHAVFTVVVCAEMLAFILVLAPGFDPAQFWGRLGVTSLFVQWIALLSAGVLCAVRGFLVRMPAHWAGLLAFVLLELLVLVVTGSIELAAQAWPFLSGSRGSSATGIFIRNLAIASVINAALLRYLYVRHQARVTQAAEAAARLQALQSRIRPHFLFNSLNSIIGMIRTDPELAERATEGLADLFRASLREAGPFATLGDEIALCRSYLDIEKLRLGDRLRVNWSIAGLPDELRVLPLLLQPLIENAVYHGVERLAEPAAIDIQGEIAGNVLRLRVTNPKPPGDSLHEQGHHIAIDNVRARLHARYGDEAGLDVQDTGTLFQVTVHFPVTGIHAHSDR